jgi:membrane protein implicated in regulation of membrane protease activity
MNMIFSTLVVHTGKKKNTEKKNSKNENLINDETNDSKSDQENLFYKEKKLQLLFLYYFLLLAGFIVLPFALFLPQGVKYALLSLPILAIILAVILKYNWKKLTKQRENLKNMPFIELLLQLFVAIVPLLCITLMEKKLRLLLFCYFVWIFIVVTAFCKFFFDWGDKYWVMLLVIILFAHLALPLHLSLGKTAQIIYLTASYLVTIPLLWYFYYSLKDQEDKSHQMIYGTVIFCLLSVFLMIPGLIQIDPKKILPNLGFMMLFMLIISFYYKFRTPAKDDS